MIKIAFDIGGVLSKYPDTFQPLVQLLQKAPEVEVHIISDMHDPQAMQNMLFNNGFDVALSRIHSADYTSHGDYCKTLLCEQLGIDIIIDDFIGYLAEGNHIRLLVMPNVTQPYYHETWANPNEADFGRRYYARPSKECRSGDCDPNPCYLPRGHKGLHDGSKRWCYAENCVDMEHYHP